VSTVNPTIGRWLAGGGGLLLLASLFLPWSEAGGHSLTGWEMTSVWDLFISITGVCGIAAASTGGRFGFFRPDLSFNAMTDIFGVVLGVLMAWLILVDFPAGASHEIGVYLTLVGAVVVATGAGDFRVTSLFPRLPQARERTSIERERR
jgi:hypothetical protein